MPNLNRAQRRLRKHEMLAAVEVLAKGVPNLDLPALRRLMGERELTVGFELEIAIEPDDLEDYLDSDDDDEDVDPDEHESNAYDRFSANWTPLHKSTWFERTYTGRYSRANELINRFEAEPKHGWITADADYGGTLVKFVKSFAKVGQALRATGQSVCKREWVAELVNDARDFLIAFVKEEGTADDPKPEEIARMWTTAHDALVGLGDPVDPDEYYKEIGNGPLLDHAKQTIDNIKDLATIALGNRRAYWREPEPEEGEPERDFHGNYTWDFLDDIHYDDFLKYFDFDEEGLEEQYTEDNDEAMRESFNENYERPEPRRSQRDAEDAEKEELAKAAVDCVAEYYRKAFPGERIIENDKYHQDGGSHRRYDMARIEPDSSIEPTGAELVGPIFHNLEDGLAWLDKALAMIGNSDHRILFTNETTGVHVNLGTFSEDERDEFDALKMLMLVGDTRILDLFNRLDNTYTGKAIDAVKRALTKGDIEYGKDLALFIGQMNKQIRSDDTKYSFANMTKFMGQGYIEFRAIGGEDYEFKADEIKQSLLRMVHSCLIAMDKTAYRREYLQALGKMLTRAKEEKVDPAEERQARVDALTNHKLSETQADLIQRFHRYIALEKMPSIRVKQAATLLYYANKVEDAVKAGGTKEELALERGKVFHKLIGLTISLDQDFAHYGAIKEIPMLTIPFLKVMRQITRLAISAAYPEKQSPAERVRTLLRTWRVMLPSVRQQQMGSYTRTPPEELLKAPPAWFFFCATGLNRYLTKIRPMIRGPAVGLQEKK